MLASLWNSGFFNLCAHITIRIGSIIKEVISFTIWAVCNSDCSVIKLLIQILSFFVSDIFILTHAMYLIKIKFRDWLDLIDALNDMILNSGRRLRLNIYNRGQIWTWRDISWYRLISTVALLDNFDMRFARSNHLIDHWWSNFNTLFNWFNYTLSCQSIICFSNKLPIFIIFNFGIKRS